jgi:leucyl-tRNA synthetase
MSDPEVREQGNRAIKVIKRLMKENIFDYFDEEKILLENKEFFERELGIELVINPEENIGNKKEVAIPTKPGIAVI